MGVSAPMAPAAVYPIPPNLQVAVMVVVYLVTAGLPLYVLFFRPVGGERVWGLPEMLAMTALFLLALPIAASSLGIGVPLSLRDLSLVTVAQNLLLAGLPVYVAVARYRLPAAALGLRGRRWGLAGIGLLAAAACVALSAAGERVAIYAIGLLEGPQQAAARAAAEHLDDPLLPVLSTLTGAGAIAWVFILLCIIVPIGEEIFFRGFVYGGLRSRWGVPAALVVSSLAFAVVHLQVVHGFPIFLLGAVFALVYQRTGSLVPAVVAHGVNNLIAVLSLWRGWGI
jgi:membrane protease YdiL (CAAX protease family)